MALSFVAFENPTDFFVSGSLWTGGAPVSFVGSGLFK